MRRKCGISRQLGYFTESKHGSFHRLNASREEVTFSSIGSDESIRVIVLKRGEGRSDLPECASLAKEFWRIV